MWRKVYRTIFYSLLFLTVLFAGAVLWVLDHTEEILLEQINIRANQDSLRNYNVSVEDIDLDLFAGDLVVENFTALPRTEFLSDTANLPPVIISYTSPEIVLKNFLIKDFLYRGDIRFDGFVLFAPKTKVYLTGAKKDDLARCGCGRFAKRN